MLCRVVGVDGDGCVKGERGEWRSKRTRRVTCFHVGMFFSSYKLFEHSKY